MTDLTRATVRQSLNTLLEKTVIDASPALGYALTAISFGETVEVTLEKAGATFVLWLKPVSADAKCYRKTARFIIGHRRDPPDRLGYALLDAACARIEVWERSLPDGAQTHLFDETPPSLTEPTLHGGTSVDPATDALLSQTTFSPIYREWLEVRERQLAARFASLKIGGRQNILLVNATRGLQFYPSLVDFCALLQRTHERVRVTSASYFDDIFQFHEGVADKGLSVVSVAEVVTWGAAEINRFDAVIHIGPSDAMGRLMALEGVTAKLVLLDLGFYHQLIDAYPGSYVKVPGSVLNGEAIIHNRSSQINRLTSYSCQPEAKIKHDLTGVCSLGLVDWHWFNYIPIGFTYCNYYRSNTHRFDVALLGSVGRDYTQIDPDLFRGLRFLFLGAAENAPDVERLLAKLDVTVVSRVNEEMYARLLALCRCVVVPLAPQVRNVFLSVMDTVAAGKALVTPRHAGLARLERDGLPAVFYDHTNPTDLFVRVDELFHKEGRLQDIEARSIAFAKEKLDIYRILWTILEEQIL